MQNTSIARRLTLGLVASLLLASTLLGWVATHLFERALRDYALGTLRDDARSVLAAIERGPAGLYLDTARLIPSYRTPLSGRYFIVEIGDQRWRSRSLWDSSLWVDGAQHPRVAYPTQEGPLAGLIDGPAGQRLLCLRAHFQRYGTDVVIIVAADVAPLLTEFRRIGFVLLGVAVVIVLSLAWLQQLWMRKSLSPLTQAQHQLQALQQGKREQLDADAPAELRPLLTEINRLLAFTRQSLVRSRNALGDLGHALKTPLAVLVSLADRADPTLKNSLNQQLTVMQQRIGRELARARTAGNVVPGIWFAPRQDLPLLIESLRFAHPHAATVSWHAPAQPVPLERDDMLELLGNLLDNACKWARQTIELQMTLQTGSSGSSLLLITLQDDGPGIDESLREHVLQRGNRLDEQTEGHGLGLGIVNDIVTAYAGDITLTESPTGGLQVDMRLPLG